jgi:ubiquinone/menaquinone biosynthesis C-methylase UbiE
MNKFYEIIENYQLSAHNNAEFDGIHRSLLDIIQSLHILDSAGVQIDNPYFYKEHVAIGAEPFAIIEGHIHEKTDALFICLEGSAHIAVDKNFFQIKAGETAFFPKGCYHEIFVDDQAATFLALSEDKIVDGDRVIDLVKIDRPEFVQNQVDELNRIRHYDFLLKKLRTIFSSDYWKQQSVREFELIIRNITKANSHIIVKSFIGEIMNPETDSKRLREIESSYYEKILQKGSDDYEKVVAGITGMHEFRNRRIALELASFLVDSTKVLDVGCGTAEVAEHISQMLSLNISGIDALIYPNDKVTIPVFSYAHNGAFPFADNEFQVGYANSVLHHIDNPESVVAEISRTVSNKFILIEDVILGETTELQEFHKTQLFLSDYFYNRVVCDIDMNVPAKYKTEQQWSELFYRHGWKVTSSSSLGISKLANIYRHRIVFER